jgi:hypothetical protein
MEITGKPDAKVSDRERKESEGSYNSVKLDGEDNGYYFYQGNMIGASQIILL